MLIPPNKSLVLFDGYCHLCNRSVQFILKFDRKGKFIFSPLTGELGETLRKNLNIPDQVDSIVLVENNSFYFRSEAVIKIARQLGGIFRLASIFSAFPVKWLDWFYNRIAANRTKWFGKRDSCMMPKPEYKDRFV